LVIDLIQRLPYGVILVSRTRLGTINHTLLSVEALKNRGIPLLGIVLSRADAQTGPEEEYTPGDITRLVRDVPVCVLPHLSEETRFDPDRIAVVMEENWPEEVLQKWLEG